MAKITIYEQDVTNAGSTNVTDNIVYVPGYAIMGPVNTPTLCNTLEEFLEVVNNKFPNCMYNGIAYRKLYLSNDIFNVPNNGKITKEILESNIRNEIRTSDLQSFSKSLSVCETFVPLLENNGPEECVIISANLKNAIDIVELSEAIKENIENDLKNEENLTRTQKNKLNFMFKQLNEMIEDFGLEEEVFGMVPDDYKILSVNDHFIDDLINEMEDK